jgi:methyl-accepting chemotaxis protein
MLKAGNINLNRFPVALKELLGRSGGLKRDWKTDLDKAGMTLVSMTTGSEGEFLRIGERLQDIHLRVRALSKLAGAAAERLSGDKIVSERDALKGILRKIGEANDASLGGSATIALIIDRLQEANGQVESFGRIVRNLKVLCNLIRIESARLGDHNEGFVALGEDVLKLIANVDSSLSTLRSRIGNVLVIMADHLLLARKFEVLQQEKTKQLLERLSQSIQKMEKQQELSCQAVQDAARRWKNISGSVGEVVSSLQFHDITRQRLEHVHEALTELREERENKAGGNESKSPAVRYLFADRKNRTKRDTPDIIAKAAATCELQTAQLQHARDDFGGAMERIAQNLGNISSEIFMLSEDIQKVAGASEEKKATYFSELEASLAILMDTIRELAEMNRKMSSSMLQVADAIGDMTSFVRDIRKVGITMRITALNACVHAAHIGESGRALGVLADSIHQLSVDTAGSIDSISSNLEGIGAEAASLSCPGGKYDQELLKKENRALLEQIDSLILPLRQMDEEMSGLLRQFDSDGNSLRQEIEEMDSHLKAHNGMASQIDTVSTSLKDVANDLRAALPEGSGRTVETALGNLAVRYTMDKEREIHAAITSQSAGTAVLPAVAEDEIDQDEAAVELWESSVPEHVPLPGDEEAPTDLARITQDDEDMGDNVELF